MISDTISYEILILIYFI